MSKRKKKKKKKKTKKKKKDKKRKEKNKELVWSNEFREFLSLCLKLDPDARADVPTLQQHVFLKQAAEPAEMASLFKRVFLELGRLTNTL